MTKVHNLNITPIFLPDQDFLKNAPELGSYAGQRLQVSWHRQKGEDAPPSLNPAGENIDIIAFSDRIPGKDFPGMELTVYFEPAAQEQDSSGEEWKQTSSSTRCRGKERLLTEVVMNDVIADKEYQTRNADDDGAIITFRNIDAAAASSILKILVQKFYADADDIKSLARAAELPVLKL